MWENVKPVQLQWQPEINEQAFSGWSNAMVAVLSPARLRELKHTKTSPAH